MEFGLLGPLMVRGASGDVPLPRGRPRSMLALLLLDAGRVVPAGKITEALWGGEPPPSAPTIIRHHVWQLRQALGRTGPQRIVTQPRGYLIRVGEGELDLARFEELLAAARSAAGSGSWELAAAAAGDALALWRGEPLADIDSDALALREVPRLAELRLQAEELRLDAVLQLGGHTEAAAELARLAAAHPLREHVHALLMLALYRCGRQADALAAYRQTRARLVAEIGAEPGIELQQLHSQVLAADPALNLTQAAVTAGPPPAGAPLAGSGPDGARALVPDVPHQLPAAVAQFTGRAAEQQMLTRMLDQAPGAPGTVVISGISGTAGVGKTTLALYWAHRVASRFPGGQLYVNLRGFDPGGAPAAPAEVIHGFLDALGVPPERLPPTAAAREGLYRSLLAGRQMLLVLDNAADEQQVRPLLPASPGTLVIVTSRRQLGGLAADGNTRLLSLDVLSHDEATRMLAARLGSERAAAEPDAVAEIAQLCSCLPLALAVTAARASTRPGLPLAALADELRETSSGLDTLDTGDPASSVPTAFSWSYRQLTPEAARMFRLLGLHPGPGISAAAAASLAGLPPAHAGRLLGQLTRAHLISEQPPGRYGFHDLLRAYAASLTAGAGDDTGQQQARARMLDHYLHTALRAAVLLHPRREMITTGERSPGVTPEHLADVHQALAWFDTEYHVLCSAVALAADAGFDAHAWQIPWAMANFMDRRGHWHEHVALHRTAVAAAERLHDVHGQATALRLLGESCTRTGDLDGAFTHLGASLALLESQPDPIAQAQAHQSMGFACEGAGRYADALRHDEQALSFYQAAGYLAGQAQMLNALGWDHTLLGEYRQARSYCQEAVQLCQQAGDRMGEAHSWDSLGSAEHRLGHLSSATDCYQHAVSIFRELGDQHLEATALDHLGDARHDAAEPEPALESWQQALGILESLKHADAERLRAKIISDSRPHTVAQG